jgi:hypothetical protein
MRWAEPARYPTEPYQAEPSRAEQLDIQAYSRHMHMPFLHYGIHVLINLAYVLITCSSHMKPY